MGKKSEKAAILPVLSVLTGLILGLAVSMWVSVKMGSKLEVKFRKVGLLDLLDKSDKSDKPKS